ncbi:helix-turn-helix domain-containing protein [Marinobacteraceae bacterium S3BR75-40.1]
MFCFSGLFLDPLYRYVRSQGWPWPEERPPSSDSRYTAAQMETLWTQLLRQPGSELLGYHAGGFLQPSSWLGLSDRVPACRSFEEAYRCLLRSQGMLAEPGFLAQRVEGDDVVLTVEWQGFTPPVHRHLTDYTLRWLVLLACWLRQPDQWISRIELPHCFTDELRSSYRFFHYALGRRGRLVQGAVKAAVVIERRLYEAGLQPGSHSQRPNGTSSGSHDFPHRALTIILERLHDGTLCRRDVARQLCMSERTLHRQLQQCGTSFGELMRQARLDTACRLLAGTDRQLLDIALDVGFRDPSNLFRLFRAELGITPADYRARARERSLSEANTERRIVVVE